MRKYLLLGLVGILSLVIAACGGDDGGDSAARSTPVATAPAAQSVPAPTAPAAQSVPAAPTAPAAQASPTSASLQDVAAKLAYGPGAIYVGDLNQLAGPAPTVDQGDSDGNVTLDALQRHLYVYESDYYRGLLERAKLANPTPLATTGEDITIQYACINRALLWCKLADSFFFPSVLERTNGQVKLELSSYPELGIAGPDVLGLIDDGTLAMADVGGPYVAGEVPALEIQYLFGLFPDQETQFNATADMYQDLVKLHEDSTGGGKMINMFWLNGNDIYFFSKKPLRTAEDFEGLKTRAFGTSIADWIEGMGADSQFIAFAEVYTALERGILEAGVAGGDAAYGQRWYEVTDYINGPLPAWPTLSSVMNKQVWEKLAPDLQQIIIEESAKTELENLRLGAIQNELGLLKNTQIGGMEYVEFSPEVRALSDKSVFESVAPNWVDRVGADSPFIQVFNEKIGTRVGLRVEPDGSVTRTEATATATTAGVPAALTAYAAEHAGGPGAIYVGDLNQLVGPSFSKDYADSDGNVPLGPLERHLYIYESDYYKSLLEKAKFTNPTQLVSEDEEFEIQYACINRAFVFCELSEVFLFPNVLERTNGQLKLVSSSYPELGIAGPDVLDLVSDGTLSMAQIIGPYVAGDVPAVEIQYLFGIFPDRETMFNASADMVPDLEKLNSEATGGGKVIYFSWSSGDDIFVSSKNPLRTPEDFDKLRVRAFGTAIADWIQGMGAESQFVAFSEVYTALERGIVEAAISGGAASFGQRWYEVADYLNGPLVSFPNTVNVVNKKVWEKLPPDLQQIFIEEGAKSELEAFRVAAIHNEVVLDQLIETGMEYVEFSPEVRALSDKAILENMVPNWVKRVGGGDKPIINVFNEKVGPRVGMRIELDGSVVKVPVTMK